MQDAEVVRFKNQLLEIRTRLMDHIRGMGEAVVEDIETPGDLSHISTHPADRDSEGIEAKMALEKTEGEILNQVAAALRRIEEGTFGRCEDCSAQIPRQRLEAIPYTPYCLNCEARREGRTSVE